MGESVESVTNSRSLGPTETLSFRDQLRAARQSAFRDAEGFTEIILCLERLGSFVHPKGRNLSHYREYIASIAESSPLANEIPKGYRDYHTPFNVLYRIIRLGRNLAAHEGVAARHLTTNAVTLALVLEDALAKHYCNVSDFMVRDPICAYFWEPLSFVRQKMLKDAFSFLPVRDESVVDPQWKVVSDRELARFLRPTASATASREDRLAMSLEEAVNEHGFELKPVPCVPPEKLVGEVATADLEDGVALVLDTDNCVGRLLGLVAAADLL